MPISVGYGSNKSLNLPQRSRRPNSAALSLGVWETKQRRQERQGEMIYRERAQYLRDQRLFGNQQALESQRFGNQEAMEDQRQEGRSRLATEKSDLDWWEEQENELSGQVDEIREESGGAFTTKGRTRYDDLQTALDALERDEDGNEVEGGRFTPRERHEARTKLYQGYLNKFKSGRDIVPPDQRPGYERITPGLRRERRGADGVYEDQGPASRLELTPEQRKAQDEALFGTDSQGRSGQYRTDRYGTYFERDKQEKADPSGSDKMLEDLQKRNALTDEIIKKRGLSKDRDLWGDENKDSDAVYEEILKEVDEIMKGDEGGGEGASGGAAPDAPVTRVGGKFEAAPVPPPTSLDDGVPTEDNSTGFLPIPPVDASQPSEPAEPGSAPNPVPLEPEGEQPARSTPWNPFINDVLPEGFEGETPTVEQRPDWLPEDWKERDADLETPEVAQRKKISREASQRRRERLGRKKDANPARRKGKTIDEYRAADLPSGAVALPDGTIWHDGKIYRRRAQ